MKTCSSHARRFRAGAASSRAAAANTAAGRRPRSGPRSATGQHEGLGRSGSARRSVGVGSAANSPSARRAGWANALSTRGMRRRTTDGLARVEERVQELAGRRGAARRSAGTTSPKSSVAGEERDQVRRPAPGSRLRASQRARMRPASPERRSAMARGWRPPMRRRDLAGGRRGCGRAAAERRPLRQGMAWSVATALRSSPATTPDAQARPPARPRIRGRSDGRHGQAAAARRGRTGRARVAAAPSAMTAARDRAARDRAQAVAPDVHQGLGRALAVARAAACTGARRRSGTASCGAPCARRARRQ